MVFNSYFIDNDSSELHTNINNENLADDDYKANDISPDKDNRAMINACTEFDFINYTSQFEKNENFYKHL